MDFDSTHLQRQQLPLNNQQQDNFAVSVQHMYEYVIVPLNHFINQQPHNLIKYKQNYHEEDVYKTINTTIYNQLKQHISQINKDKTKLKQWINQSNDQKDVFVVIFGFIMNLIQQIVIKGCQSFQRPQSQYKCPCQSVKSSASSRVSVYSLQQSNNEKYQEQKQKLINFKKECQIMMKQIDKQRIKNEHNDEMIQLLIKAAKQNYKIGQFKQANQLLQQALKKSQHLHGKNSENYAKILFQQVRIYYCLKKLDISLNLCEKVQSIRSQINKETNQYANTLIRIGILYKDKSQLNKDKSQLNKDNSQFLETARMYYDRALKIKRSIYPQKHIKLANPLLNLALLLFKKNEHLRALQLFQQVLEIDKNFYGDKQHFQIANAEFNVAACKMQLKQHKEAIQSYYSAVKMVVQQQIWKNQITQNHLKQLNKYIIQLKQYNLDEQQILYILKILNYIQKIPQIDKYIEIEISKLRDQFKKKLNQVEA